MGKLHTLKREIKRNPDRWVSQWRDKGTGAYFDKRAGRWEPLNFWWTDKRSYQGFVDHVLRGLGYFPNRGQ